MLSNFKLKRRKKYLLFLILVPALLAPVILLTKNEEHVANVVLSIGGEEYYIEGNCFNDTDQDIPGHTWRVTDSNKLEGRHYNTGDDNAAQWWASYQPDHVLIYQVKAIIDEWSPRLARYYASLGYTHYERLEKVSDGSFHPYKVVWLQHKAVRNFFLDGGPNPELYAHHVSRGIDYGYMPNWFIPYKPFVVQYPSQEYLSAISLQEVHD